MKAKKLYQNIETVIHGKRVSKYPLWRSFFWLKDGVRQSLNVARHVITSVIWFWIIFHLKKFYEFYVKGKLLMIRRPHQEGTKLTVIVPYRDRAEHLEKFIAHMQSFLSDIEYEIVVVEQAEGKLFNRGKLLNVGFDLTQGNKNYFCFHDVDLLPENKHCDYRYPFFPTHPAVFLEQFKYKICYLDYFGGVVLFNQKDFEGINGCSNEYWGWGCEDDDLRKRVQNRKLPCLHRKGRYASLPHESLDSEATRGNDFHQKNQAKLTSEYDYEKDGLSTLEYRVLEKGNFDGYTKYVVEI